MSTKKRAKLSSFQLAIQAQTQERAAVYAKETADREALLKANASKALELAAKALELVQELVGMEKAMSDQVPYTSFIDPSTHSATLEDAAHALGIVVHAAQKLK